MTGTSPNHTLSVGEVTKPTSNADRNLLFGILALQNGFINREQLLAAFNSWVVTKDKPLGEILREQKALTPAEYAALDPLVQAHLKKHGDDAQQSLAAVSSIRSVRRELEQIADPDVQASLVHVSAARKDPYATDAGATVVGLALRILRPHREGGLGKVSVAGRRLWIKISALCWIR